MRAALPALALLALSSLGGCSRSGTGVLLTIDGSGVGADHLTIRADYDGKSIAHDVPTAARTLTFPATVVIALPDRATSISLTVTAFAGGQAVAMGTTPAPLAVAAHQTIDATVDLTAIGGGGGDMGDGGGVVAACGKTALLVDPFTAGVSDGLWTPYATGGVTAAPIGGALAITMPGSAAGGSEAGYPTTAWYDITGSSIAVDVPQMVALSTQAYAGLSIGLDNGDYLEISQEQGVLSWDGAIAGTRNQFGSIAYDGIAQRWWRIREAGGTIYFETAPDGVTWTMRGSTPTPSWAPFVQVNLFAGADGTVASGGEAHFDQLNGGTATGGRCAAATLSDDFSDGVRGPQWLGSYSFHCNVTETGGQLDFALQPTPSDGEYISSYGYDLTGSAIFVEVPAAPQKSDGASSWLRANVDETNGSGYEIDEDEGQIYFQRKNADGSSTVRATMTYDAVADRWWRIRESGGTVYYETAPDGKAWTVRASEPVSLAVTAIRVHLGVTVYDAAATSPGHVDFAQFNLAPP